MQFIDKDSKFAMIFHILPCIALTDNDTITMNIGVIGKCLKTVRLIFYKYLKRIKYYKWIPLIDYYLEVFWIFGYF